jgi:cleavage and polyadenylation specificity factor subunit 3
MTHPTRHVYHSLLKDFVKMGKGSSNEALYTEEDLDASMALIEVVDFHQTLSVDGIKVRGYRTPVIQRCVGQ